MNKRTKKLVRVLIIILFSPVLLLILAIGVGVMIPLLIATFCTATIEYGFTGKWDWII